VQNKEENRVLLKNLLGYWLLCPLSLESGIRGGWVAHPTHMQCNVLNPTQRDGNWKSVVDKSMNIWARFAKYYHDYAHQLVSCYLILLSLEITMTQGDQFDKAFK
jgi:hypothetical protein